MLTAIVAAMEEEIGPLRARLTDVTVRPATGARVSVGKLGDAPVALAVTGDGARNARRGLAALLAVVPAGRIIVVGVAGGLSADLEVAGLVVGERVVDESSGGVSETDSSLTELVATASGARRGVVASAVRIADTAAEKQRLLALAAPDAGHPAAVVDLESAAFAGVAMRASLPFTVLRAVSDPAGESVPALLNQSRDAGGAVRRGRVALGLLSRPGDLRRLLELRDRVRACAGGLARAVEVSVAAIHAVDVAAAAAAPPMKSRSHSPIESSGKEV